MNFLKTVGKITLIVLNTLAAAFVLYKAWEWFMPHLFPNSPSLSFNNALILRILLSWLTERPINVEDEYKTKEASQYIAATILPWITLLLMWILYIIGY